MRCMGSVGSLLHTDTGQVPRTRNQPPYGRAEARQALYGLLVALARTLVAGLREQAHGGRQG